MNLIENIEKIMMEKNITKYKLEKDTGIKQTTFQGWKRGSQPAADKIYILLSYLEVTPNELFGIEKDNSLTKEEKLIVDYYRNVTPEVKKIIKTTLEVSQPVMPDQSSTSKTG